MSDNLIHKPTLSYERYKVYQRHLNDLNKRDTKEDIGQCEIRKMREGC